MNKKSNKPEFCGLQITHAYIDELEQARIQLGMTEKEFAEYFESLKPTEPLVFKELLIYGTAGGMEGSPFR